MGRGGLLTLAMVLASCGAAPEVRETKLDEADSPEAVAAIRMQIAQRRALARLLPTEVFPHDGRQPDGSLVRCEEVDVDELKRGRSVVLERFAAETCARAARVLCDGGSVTEQQVELAVGSGRVETDCMQETASGRKFGTLFCRAEGGVYDEADGKAGVVCTSIDQMAK